MDTVTHTLFGLTLYGAVNKTGMTRRERAALLVTTVIGSQIPDIDVISAWWDTEGRYQMWHRGITHSLFLVPVWSALITASVQWISHSRKTLLFIMACLSVFIHDTSDIFNAWGTGYFEPFSSVRLTLGTIPILDLFFWAAMAGGFLLVRFGRGRWHKPSHLIYRGVWALMLFHAVFQTVQGGALLHQHKSEYDQIALSADFVPGVFTVIGKSSDTVTISKGTIWTGLQTETILKSSEGADLNGLFVANPKARTLVEWAPFVIIEEKGKRIGVYDPRFYRNGQSFLYEFMDRE